MKILGIEITNPDRKVNGKIEKIEVVKYYEKVAPLILPYLKNRYVSELRCHGGISECFFKKHPENEPDKLIEIRSKKDLILAVQLGSIEIHPYTISNKTSTMVFDLDPDTNLKQENVIQGAFHIKEILDSCGLFSFIKTSGGKGHFKARNRIRQKA